MKIAQFEVGKTYYSDGFTITVIKRTAKTIVVTNSTCTWRMLIRRDDKSEYVIDSLVPKKWQWSQTYRASREVR